MTDRPEGLAEWVVVGARVGVLSGRDSVAVHTVDRIGKRDVVLSNGLRMRPYGNGSGDDADLVRRAQSAWSSSDYGYHVGSETFTRAHRRYREKDALAGVENCLRDRSRRMQHEPLTDEQLAALSTVLRLFPRIDPT